jgi:hypothetical protein
MRSRAAEGPLAAFLPAKWRKLIFANGTPDRRLYEVAVLGTLRERLRGSDIGVAGSRDYRAFEDICCPLKEFGTSVSVRRPILPGLLEARAAFPPQTAYNY